jgi:hypothetical protein
VVGGRWGKGRCQVSGVRFQVPSSRWYVVGSRWGDSRSQQSTVDSYGRWGNSTRFIHTLPRLNATSASTEVPPLARGALT